MVRGDPRSDGLRLSLLDVERALGVKACHLLLDAVREGSVTDEFARFDGLLMG